MGEIMIQTVRGNCLDANRCQKLESSASHLWAVLLAGGDGVRLRDLTRRIAGDSRPKQFCRIIGGQSLFRQTRAPSLTRSSYAIDRYSCFLAPTKDIMVRI